MYYISLILIIVNSKRVKRKVLPKQEFLDYQGEIWRLGEHKTRVRSLKFI